MIRIFENNNDFNENINASRFASIIEKEVRGRVESIILDMTNIEELKYIMQSYNITDISMIDNDEEIVVELIDEETMDMINIILPYEALMDDGESLEIEFIEVDSFEDETMPNNNNKKYTDNLIDARDRFGNNKEEDKVGLLTFLEDVFSPKELYDNFEDYTDLCNEFEEFEEHQICECQGFEYECEDDFDELGIGVEINNDELALALINAFNSIYKEDIDDVTNDNVDKNAIIGIMRLLNEMQDDTDDTEDADGNEDNEVKWFHNIEWSPSLIDKIDEMYLNSLIVDIEKLPNIDELEDIKLTQESLKNAYSYITSNSFIEDIDAAFTDSKEEDVDELESIMDIKTRAYLDGYEDGKDEGYELGFKHGNDEAYDLGLEDGINKGYEEGISVVNNEEFSKISENISNLIEIVSNIDKHIYDKGFNAGLEQAEAVKERVECVICGKDTGQYQLTPISERERYIDNIGQVCQFCYDNIVKKK